MLPRARKAAAMSGFSCISRQHGNENSKGNSNGVGRLHLHDLPTRGRDRAHGHFRPLRYGHPYSRQRPYLRPRPPSSRRMGGEGLFFEKLDGSVAAECPSVRRLSTSWLAEDTHHIRRMGCIVSSRSSDGNLLREKRMHVEPIDATYAPV